MNIISKLSRALPTFLVLLSLSALCSAQEKKRIAYGILLDNTGSMRTQFDRVKEIGKAVAQQIHEHGPISIFDFHSQGILKPSRAVPILRLEQSQDRAVLEDCINNLYVEGGQTTLLDAVQFIAERLGEKDEACRWLNEAYRRRIGGLALLKVEPRFENLHSDPRFADLLHQMNLTP